MSTNPNAFYMSVLARQQQLIMELQLYHKFMRRPISRFEVFIEAGVPRDNPKHYTKRQENNLTLDEYIQGNKLILGIPGTTQLGSFRTLYSVLFSLISTHLGTSAEMN